MLVALLPLPGRLAWLIGVFCDTMPAEACKRRLGLLSIALWTRVRRLERRFCALHAMWKAGTLPRAPSRAGCPPSPCLPRQAGAEMLPADVARVRPASVLPRALRWMQAMLPMSAGTLASGMGPLVLDCPETQAFVAACPQAGRILRPLCRMAGLKAPEWLALPRRTRPKPGGERETLPPHPLAARFPDTPAARAAARALARMQAGLPVDVKKLSAVAYGYYIHPPRDDNCPPPEIGYGGRAFPPLPKDYVRPDDAEGAS